MLQYRKISDEFIKALGYNPNTEDGDKENEIDKNPNNLKVEDKFYGSIVTSVKNKNGRSERVRPLGDFKVISSESSGTKKVLTVKDSLTGKEYKTSPNSIKIQKKTEGVEKALENKKKAQEKQKKEEEAAALEAKMINFKILEPEDKLKKLIEAGMRNLWMVGPAGCGKSTMTRNIATSLDIPYLCISCGIGTSATEFTGYKYPTRESTKFAEFYSKASIILIDEMTALDPAVGQVINAALANGEIETTTGLVTRHPDCIIIATSNTFGNGANRQYVANNQLDASTIDRFIGGIVEVDYSKSYELQYDKEVVTFVWNLRSKITELNLRRIASTRMIQSGTVMKNAFFKNWKDILLTGYTKQEKDMILSNEDKPTWESFKKAA